jgi:hypothetical protein
VACCGNVRPQRFRPSRAARLFPAAARLVGFCIALCASSPREATAAPDDADKAIAELRQDAAHRALLEAPLGKADQALGRARAMDHAGDTAHAALMRAVARKWIDLSHDLIRTVDMEARAEAAERALDQLETKMVRGRALLEETVARRGRAQETLAQLGKPTPAQQPSQPTKPRSSTPAAPKQPTPSPPPAEPEPPVVPAPAPPMGPHR